MKKFLLSTAACALVIAGAQAQNQVKKTDKQPEPAATRQNAKPQDTAQPSRNADGSEAVPVMQAVPSEAEKATPAGDTANRFMK